MAAVARASIDATTSPAQSLFNYLRIRSSRITVELATQVVDGLEASYFETTKAMAKRLREALHAKGITVKYTAALEAASRVSGHPSWQAARRATPMRLEMHVLDGQPREYVDWTALAADLVGACKSWLSNHPARALELRLSPKSLMVGAHVRRTNGPEGQFDLMPVLAIRPLVEADDWMAGAGPTFERLRRALEETRLAMLDGVAVLQLCESKVSGRRSFSEMEFITRVTDACNSELVLRRADEAPNPHRSYEIARGDELSCWEQFDLDRKGTNTTEEAVRIDDDGGWMVGETRYAWEMTTVQPKSFIPGLQVMMLGPDVAEQLLRRYRLAQHIFTERVVARDSRKMLDWLSGPEESYRIDLHRLLRVLHDRGYTWESYGEEANEHREMEPELPLGFVLNLVNRLKVPNASELFARPTRADLARVTDDKMLLTLMPRADVVRAHIAADVPFADRARIREVVDTFASAIGLNQMARAGMDLGERFPHACFVDDALELQAAIEHAGLMLYVGAMPHLMWMDRSKFDLPVELGDYAFGHALYIEVGRQ